MRKIIVLACVVALLLTVSGAAMASTTQWILWLRAGVVSGTVLVGGNDAGAGVHATNPDTTVTAYNNGAVNVDMNQSTGGNKIDYKVPSGDGPYTYTMTVAVGTASGAGSQVYIGAWAGDKNGAQSGWTLPTNYVVEVKKGSTVKATWSYATNPEMWTGTVAQGAGKKPATGFLYTYDSQVASYGASTDILTVIVGAPIPEPGSMLALGSGLIGMAGFALRRRRA